jgi:hypothetical protein
MAIGYFCYDFSSIRYTLVIQILCKFDKFSLHPVTIHLPLKNPNKSVHLNFPNS